MKISEEIFEILKNKFPDYKFGLETETPVEPVLSADPLKINEIAHFLAENEDLFFDSLMNLSGVDDANGEKSTDADGAEIITGGTLSVYYHLHSMKFNHKLTVKVSTPRENPEVESVEGIWKTANWHEREAYDMVGIIFLNHPDLERILMPYDWEEGSHPLRKDYKNPEFYHGMRVPY
ncbi:MAG: NADH-quinone oxidoreductase subunit C [Melioribacteraceae bacterium]|nr:NADH-quinone oxidoreductase subunit C [Melioribacteraceae bacterium]